MIEFEVPYIESSYQDSLYQRYQVDSWAFRLEKKTGENPRIYGHVAIFFRNTKKDSSNSLKIYYAAAAASERFRNFSCPAFSHRKQIAEMDIDRNGPSTVDFFLKFESTLSAKVYQSSFFPSSFNGGKKLEGEYIISMAAYSSKEKKLFSPWFPLEGKIKIQREEEIGVPSCIGSHEEYDTNNSINSKININKFKMGK